MSKFNMSPSGLKPVGSQHETTFTKMLKSSNDVSQKQGGAAKQTKFTEYITSSNQHRSEIEKQKETIANLNAQINELTEREDDVASEKKKYSELSSKFDILSKEFSALHVQLQEAKAREESSVLDYTKELQVKNDEIKELKEANKKFETENEDLLDSWDKLRIQGEEQMEKINKLESELMQYKSSDTEQKSAHENLLNTHEALVKRHGEITADRDKIKKELDSTTESLTTLRQSLME